MGNRKRQSLVKFLLLLAAKGCQPWVDLQKAYSPERILTSGTEEPADGDTCTQGFCLRAELVSGFEGCHSLGTTDATLRTSLSVVRDKTSESPFCCQNKDCSWCALWEITNVNITPTFEPLISWDGELGGSLLLALYSGHSFRPPVLPDTVLWASISLSLSDHAELCIAFFHF